uniref:Uncharacterized protein n=1 Tax=Rhizophora mucronata TaxID=61149 RepID=A0A2P2N6G9_RHIMU
MGQRKCFDTFSLAIFVIKVGIINFLLGGRQPQIMYSMQVRDSNVRPIRLSVAAQPV